MIFLNLDTFGCCSWSWMILDEFARFFWIWTKFIIFFYFGEVSTILNDFVSWMRLSIVPSIRSRWAVSNGGPLLFVAYDLSFLLFLFGTSSDDFGRLCVMNEAVDSTINQIASSSFEWWSSFVCSLQFELFRRELETWSKYGPNLF